MSTGGAAAGDYIVYFRLVDRIANDFSRSMRGFSQITAQIRSFAFAGGALVGGLTAAMTPAIRRFAEFDDVVRQVGAISGSTGKQLEALRKQMRALGESTSFTASQVGQGMKELARTGLSVSEIQASTEHVLNLARATDIELAMAADFAATTMRGFNLAAGDMQHITDVLTATVNTSAQNMEMLGDSMKLVMGISNLMGVSLEETSGALAVMANRSIRGSIAGTGLRQCSRN
jgi:TP901 family phage tail tape measure protein